jgi:hypothetical protein
MNGYERCSTSVESLNVSFDQDKQNEKRLHYL